MDNNRRYTSIMPIAPDYIAEAARKGLEARDKAPNYLKAGTRVGLARANQLANKENISTQTLLRMRSYLARAEDAYRKAREAGKTIDNSKAIQAYYLWGGPRAMAWVNRELKKEGR